MEYPNNIQISLNRRLAQAVIILLILLFICYGQILCSRLLAYRYTEQALNYLEKARALTSEMLIKKSLFYQDALKWLKKAIMLNPSDAELYYKYAEVIKELTNDDLLQASLYYKKAILKQPTNALYHQRLGDIYDKLSDTESAEKEFNNALLLDPENITIHLYLSQYFLSKNNHDKFLEHLERAISLYKANLGGGPIANMVEDFARRVNREDLIK